MDKVCEHHTPTTCNSHWLLREWCDPSSGNTMAANKLVEQLNRDLLECGICLDRFKKPRGLPCLHCFCQECLESYCKGQKQILCPICKKQTSLPEDGVSALPAHFMVNTLQDTFEKVWCVKLPVATFFLKGVLHPRPFFDCLCISLKNYNTLVKSKTCL